MCWAGIQLIRPVCNGAIVYTFNLGTNLFERYTSGHCRIRIQILDKNNCELNEINFEQSKSVQITRNDYSVFNKKIIPFAKKGYLSESKIWFEEQIDTAFKLINHLTPQKIETAK